MLLSDLMVGFLIYSPGLWLMIRRADAYQISRMTAFWWSLLGPLGTIFFFWKYSQSKMAARALLPPPPVEEPETISPLMEGLYRAGTDALNALSRVVETSIENQQVAKQAKSDQLESGDKIHELPKIAGDIMSRASGAYALWVILVTSNFLDETWSKSDWLTQLLSKNKLTGKFEKLSLPFSGDVLNEKFDAAVPEAILLFQLSVSYQKGFTGLVYETAQASRASNAFQNIDNFLEWFERASQLHPTVAATIGQREELKKLTDELLTQLNARDPAFVHQIYVNATELTFSA